MWLCVLTAAVAAWRGRVDYIYSRLCCYDCFVIALNNGCGDLGTITIILDFVLFSIKKIIWSSSFSAVNLKKIYGATVVRHQQRLHNADLLLLPLPLPLPANAAAVAVAVAQASCPAAAVAAVVGGGSLAAPVSIPKAADACTAAWACTAAGASAAAAKTYAAAAGAAAAEAYETAAEACAAAAEVGVTAAEGGVAGVAGVEVGVDVGAAAADIAPGTAWNWRRGVVQLQQSAA